MKTKIKMCIFGLAQLEVLRYGVLSRDYLTVSPASVTK